MNKQSNFQEKYQKLQKALKEACQSDEVLDQAHDLACLLVAEESLNKDGLGDWSMIEETMKVHRKMLFKTYKEAFLTALGEELTRTKKVH